MDEIVDSCEECGEEGVVFGCTEDSCGNATRDFYDPIPADYA